MSTTGRTSYTVSITDTQLVQILSESCSVSSLTELRKQLENRSRVRERLVEDLRKKRKN